MTIAFHGLPTDQVARTRAQQIDAYGAPPVHGVSSGAGTPCRHCLRTVPEGAPFLILAWRPFTKATAYAETGPIFLCAEDCAAASPSERIPPMLEGARYTLRPYNATPMIRYGHERLVDTRALPDAARDMLADPETAFVDVRNPLTGCYQCRITRH